MLKNGFKNYKYHSKIILKNIEITPYLWEFHCTTKAPPPPPAKKGGQNRHDKLLLDPWVKV